MPERVTAIRVKMAASVLKNTTAMNASAAGNGLVSTVKEVNNTYCLNISNLQPYFYFHTWTNSFLYLYFYILIFVACSGELDLVLVIDTSGSIRQSRFDIVKEFIRNVTEQLEVRPNRVQVALLTYADQATRRFQFTTFSEKEDVLHAIDSLPYSRGRTNAADAIQMMQDQLFIQAAGDRPNVPNVALVFTDGYSNVQKELTVPNAIEARIEGTHIMVVSVENKEDNLELKGMVSDPDSYNLFNVNSYDDLETIVERVVEAMCDGKS